jgi:hypothetical protein
MLMAPATVARVLLEVIGFLLLKVLVQMRS